MPPIEHEGRRRPHAPGGARRRAMLVAGAGAVALAATGCGPSLSLVTVPWTDSQAKIHSAIFGDKKVTFEKSPVIKVNDGRIEKVVVKKAGGGGKVSGEMAAGGSAWRLDESDLEFGTKYTVKAAAVDLRGRETKKKSSFTTFTPERELSLWTNVNDGSTYGVGMPITVSFNNPVTEKKKIEKRLHVTVDTKNQPKGRWSWDSDTSVSYRTKEYWPAHTNVTFDADIRGVNAGNGTYALTDFQREFWVGTRNIMIADAASHRYRVYQDNVLVRDMPTSTGRPGDATRSGIKVLMSKETNVIFTAAVAESDPDYYRIPIQYAMRVTWSGEYVHSAPWSVGSQGNANVSHGCINLSTPNAAWVYHNSNVGDIVQVINSGRGQELGNGITVWNESWDGWKAGSAL